ncbi:MAG: glycoside hydrolase family 15 protein [Cyanobacteria bacterium J06598_1]
MNAPTHYQINSSALRPITKAVYSKKDLADIQKVLSVHKTLEFTPTSNGLFPAAATADSENTGYKYVWVRDNVYVAYAHYVMEEHAVAAKTLTELMTYFQKFSFHFADIIKNPELKEQVMKRPHIRFNGESLTEIDENWEHAQNDALGYFVWLYCTLATQPETQSLVGLDAASTETLSQFLLYFDAIQYWQDLDSGHWEEGRKISASSIGAVVAGLKALRSLTQSHSLSLPQTDESSDELISRLIQKGESALSTILPWECRTTEGKRRYDAALLYLIYPLKVVNRAQAKEILSDVNKGLTGDYGIQRYPYDSFWCRDFQDLDKSIQTAQYTGREAWLKEHNRDVKRGEEAQWCIFDPIISAIYGEWFQESGEAEYLELQTLHLNRALGQITGEGNTVEAGKGSNEPVEIPANRCPELYYIQHDSYVPNVSTPLLWTQANLCIALKLMEQSLDT